MNLLRSLFIVFFAIGVFLLAAYAGFQLVQGAHPALSWLGLLISAATPLAFLARNRFSKTTLHAQQAVGFSACCGLGIAICMASSWKHGDSAGLVHVGAGLCLLGWFAYLKWYLRGQA